MGHLRVLQIIEVGGAIASVSSWTIALYFQWQGEPRTQRNIAIATAAAFVVLVVLAHRRRVIAARDLQTISDEIILSLDIGREYEIFYSTRFKRPPFLKTTCIEGGIDFDIIEQRPDGFKFKTRGSSAYGTPNLKVRFTAVGPKAHDG